MIKKISHMINATGATIREKLKSIQRSPGWNNVRDSFIESHPVCAACGSNKKLQVHHISPFSNHPELELDEKNLIVLCMDTNECHLLIGHGGAFRFYNPNVVEDSLRFMSASSGKRRSIIKEAKKKRLD